MYRYVLIPITIGLFVISGTGCIPSPASTPALLPTFTAAPFSNALPTVFVFPSSTAVNPTPAPNTTLPFTAVPATGLPAVHSTQVGPGAFCTDVQATALIDRFKIAVQTSNGDLLGSLVSPDHGMEVRLYRMGRVVTYDAAHAKFLFQSSFQLDWGAAPASGLATKGSFHEEILPVLLKLFNNNYTLKCDQIQVGGTTYQATWPYPGINFYSAYYPGTQPNSSLDWLSWQFGIEYVNGGPYLYSIMHFEWEP